MTTLVRHWTRGMRAASAVALLTVAAMPAVSEDVDPFDAMGSLARDTEREDQAREASDLVRTTLASLNDVSLLSHGDQCSSDASREALERARMLTHEWALSYTDDFIDRAALVAREAQGVVESVDTRIETLALAEQQRLAHARGVRLRIMADLERVRGLKVAALREHRDVTALLASERALESVLETMAAPSD